MSKIEEFLSSGDTHIIAKNLVKDFLCEMKNEFPIFINNIVLDNSKDLKRWADEEGIEIAPHVEAVLWFDKWFGATK